MINALCHGSTLWTKRHKKRLFFVWNKQTKKKKKDKMICLDREAMKIKIKKLTFLDKQKLVQLINIYLFYPLRVKSCLVTLLVTRKTKQILNCQKLIYL